LQGHAMCWEFGEHYTPLFGDPFQNELYNLEFCSQHAIITKD
jgi:hypothetical protein